MVYQKSNNFLYRDIVKKLESWFIRDEVMVILGARQVGKTSLLFYLKNNLEAEGKKTYFIDLEDIELRASIKSARNLISFLETLGWRKGEKTFVLLDEIHYIENITSILKYLHDHYPELKFIVTGSSSLRLKFKMAEPLTGRKVIFSLFPLSFREFLRFSGKEQLKDVLARTEGNPITEPFLSQVVAAYEEYMIYGGYPKVALTPSYELKAQILKEIQTTYVDKELRGLIKEESFGKFGSFIEFLAAQNSGLVKISEISSEVGIARDTVQRYLTILEETYIIGLLRPLARSRQKEITRLPKLYFLDTGFLNFILKDFRPLSIRPDVGKLFETALYATLLRELTGIEEMRFLRMKSGDEIDFILRRAKVAIPIEAKWRAERKLPNAFRRFLRDMKCEKGYIATKHTWEDEMINGSQVKFLPAWAIETELWGKNR